jgi:hypothetical protein
MGGIEVGGIVLWHSSTPAQIPKIVPAIAPIVPNLSRPNKRDSSASMLS